MEIPGNRDLNNQPQRPLKHLRARRAIGFTLIGAMALWLFAAPIVQAKPQDRATTSIIISVLVLLLALVLGPTLFLKWRERSRRR